MHILFWILGVSAVPIAASVLAYLRHSRRHDRVQTSVTLASMHKWVDAMLSLNASGSHLIFDVNEREGFLQVVLTGREGDWRRVELCLPDAAWSHEIFAVAVLHLGEGADECEVEEDPTDPEVPRFLWVTIEGDRERVGERVADLLQSAGRILGFSQDDTFTARGDGRRHPDVFRAAADRIEALPRRRWLTRRIAAKMRAHADALEREPNAPAP